MTDDRLASRQRYTDDEELMRQAESGLSGQGAVVESMRRLRAATTRSAWVMIVLTIVIAILTAIMAFPEITNWARGALGVPPVGR